ncbi:MAG: hypothetical protein AAGC55_00850 [Myxococcota bacterium]
MNKTKKNLSLTVLALAFVASIVFTVGNAVATESTANAADDQASATSSAVAVASASATDLEPAAEICHCVQQTTATFTKVGATCLKARTKARDAARAAAVCPPHAVSCGAVSHTISTCSPIPNGYQASAHATYYCEYCIDKPDDPYIP